MARRGLASAGGDIVSSALRASILSRVPAAREKAMQAALISILTGEYTIQAMPIAHYRHQSPGMFVRLISGGNTQPAPSPSCCGARQQNTNVSRMKRIQVGWEVGEGQPGEGKGARQGGEGDSASLQQPTNGILVWATRDWLLGRVRDWVFWVLSGTANCGAMVMAASISRFQGPSLPAYWAGCELSNRVSRQSDSSCS